MRYLTSERERDLLRINSRGNALEIGAYDGGSSIEIAKSCVHLWCIDDFVNYGEDGIQPSITNFISNTRLYSNIHLIKGKSEDVLPILPSSYFDFIFIDGNHKEEAVQFDTLEALRLLKIDGIIAMHDFGSMPAVSKWGDYLLSLFRNYITVDMLRIASNSEIKE